VSSNFIQDNRPTKTSHAGRSDAACQTRFPPGRTRLTSVTRIDLSEFRHRAGQPRPCSICAHDTNPTPEIGVLAAIEMTVRWLGFDWNERLFLCLRLLSSLCNVYRST